MNRASLEDLADTVLEEITVGRGSLNVGRVARIALQDLLLDSRLCIGLLSL